MTESTHYEQLLRQNREQAEQIVKLKAERGRLETDLGHARQQLELSRAGARERQDLLTEARDLLEPWGAHGNGWPSLAPAINELVAKLDAALARARAAETDCQHAETMARLAVPLICSDERHVAKVAALEAQLAAVRVVAERLAEGSSWDGNEPAAAEDLLEILDTKPVPGTCPPACTEGHRYEAGCLLDPLNHVGIGSITYLGSGRGMWAWCCGGDEQRLLCTGEFGDGQETAAAARRAHDRHVAAEHTEARP